MNNSAENSLEHRETWDLLPWYVNSRIAAPDRDRVNVHLQTCALCRDELAQQRQLFQAIATASTIEHVPAASLKGLRQRLSAPTAAPQPRATPLFSRPLLLAASAAAVTVALGVIAVVSWNSPHSLNPDASYYTVTSATPPARMAVIRAVFDPGVTVSQLQVLLDESRLRIVAGPTEAGVYSLAATSSQPVSTSLQRLRQHPTVRFAEATVAASGTEP
jgi:anti-sigma factor RsiW